MIQLDELKKTLGVKQIKLDISTYTIKFLAKKGYYHL